MHYNKRDKHDRGQEQTDVRGPMIHMQYVLDPAIALVVQSELHAPGSKQSSILPLSPIPFP